MLNSLKNFFQQSEKTYQNIVWILDCSVNANFLGINDSVYNTTPFLKDISNQYINIGSVASVTNCSAISNIYLMGMGKNNDLPDFEENLLKNPSIFAYAKNAGYKFVKEALIRKFGEHWYAQLEKVASEL